MQSATSGENVQTTTISRFCLARLHIRLIDRVPASSGATVALNFESRARQTKVFSTTIKRVTFTTFLLHPTQPFFAKSQRKLNEDGSPQITITTTHNTFKMADTNPANFANRPTEEVKAIASKGGHAAHEKVC